MAADARKYLHLPLIALHEREAWMAISNAEMLSLARELPIPVPWDRNVLVDNLARQRGRPIRLIPTDITAAFADVPCGLLMEREHDDWILHEVGTTDYHIDQIVCHEIGHMLLGHNNLRKPGDGSAHVSELCSKFLPGFDLSTVRELMGRTSYATEQEREAEIFANMVMIAAAEAAARQSMMNTVFFRR